MNRFEFTTAALVDGEAIVVKHDTVKIYDGHEKVSHQMLLDCDFSGIFFF